MADAHPPQAPSWFGENWNLLAQLVLWIMGIIGNFWLAPPAGAAENPESDYRFAQLIVAVIAGLLIVLAWTLGKKHLWLWVLIALLSLALSIGGYFTYKKFSNDWLCKYKNVSIVTGDYTEQARKLLTDPKCSNSCQDMIKCLGNAESVWDKASMDNRRLTLTAIYFAGLPFLTMCIMAITQAVYCAKRPEVAAPVAG